MFKRGCRGTRNYYLRMQKDFEIITNSIPKEDKLDKRGQGRGSIQLKSALQI